MQALLASVTAAVMALASPTNVVHPKAGMAPRAASSTWAQEAFGHLEAQEYQATESSRGLQAPNREQNLRTYFRGDHIEVVPRRRDEAPPWRFRWRTERWGREGRWVRIEPAAPITEEARVCYHSPGLVEWYENRPQGIEQGFTVERRPSGDGPLRIEGVIGGGLRAKSSGPAIDFYDPKDVHVLHYDALQVWDAAGRRLESRFEVRGDHVAIVVEDGNAPYPITVDPVLTSATWIGTGDTGGDGYGWSVATAGDVNRDGFSDVLVGAMRYDGAFTDEGAVFLYLGSAAGLSSSPAWEGFGGQESAQFGWSAATAGDVNGDGFDDVIVGAVYHEATMFRQGRAYVYHGSAGGLSPAPDWTVDGEMAEAILGSSVGTAGDVNGDGFDDVIVGSADFTDGEEDEGRAYVYHGSAAGLSVSPAWSVDGDQAGARLGYKAAAAGDLDSDGFDDVVVGAYLYDNGLTDEGAAWVYMGSAAGLESVAAWMASGGRSGAELGRALGAAGDVNGDGYADLAVAAPLYDGSLTDHGVTYVFPGTSTGVADSTIWTLYANAFQAEFGSAVGTAGDVNGDGFSDLVVGAPKWGGEDVGHAYVYLGSASGWVLDSDLTPNDPFSDYGQAVATAGDVDGDGFSDVIIGSWLADEGGTDRGAAYLYRGSATGLSDSTQWTAEVDQEDARLGYAVSGAGDVNGDGFSDVIIGARFYDAGGESEGAAFAYQGSADGLDPIPAWSATGGTSFSYLGWSVSGAGDVNGDGFDDVIVGAPYHDHGGGEDGAAYVYLGGGSGLAQDPVWIAGDGLDPCYFGWDVAAAGDVNGDGFADVIVGAPYYEDGEAIEGGAFVYLGSDSGPSAAPDWSAESNQATARMGHSVGSVGDANGDGFDDIVVGVMGYSNGQNVEGAVYVYDGSPEGPAPAPTWIKEGDEVDAFLGTSVSTAGDVNGDGFSDLIAGAPGHNGGQGFEGGAYLFPGSPTGLDAMPAWFVESADPSSEFGTSVSTAGDLNGDGYSDVIVGAPYDDTGAVDGGRVHVYLGSPSGLSPSADWVEIGEQTLGEMGRAVASAGDVNGDGFSDLLIGEPKYTGGEDYEGAAHLYYGSGGDGRALVPQQRRTDDSAPIALGGLSDSPTSFLVTAVGRSAEGRTEVRMEVEIKPADAAFDGTGTLMTEGFDTGLTGVDLARLVTGLEPEAGYHWRLRLVADSPFFPRSPWFSPQGNAPTELDLRTPAGTSSVDPPVRAVSVIRLAPARPNPFRSSTSVSFEIGQSGHGQVAIYDVSGRRVVVLADRRFEPGRHHVTWDGRAASGAEVAEGIYFVRLTFGGSVATRSLALLR